MDIQIKRGLLDVCVLAALEREDSYGYKIIKDVPEKMKLTESTLYPILRRLETAECLTVNSVEHNGRLRKYYSLTDNGRQRIRDFLNEWEDVMLIYTFIKEGVRNE